MKKTNKKKEEEQIDEMIKNPDMVKQELLIERIDELNYTVLDLLEKIEVFQALENERLKLEGKLEKLSEQDETEKEEFKILQDQIKLLRKRLGLPLKTASKKGSNFNDNKKDKV